MAPTAADPHPPASQLVIEVRIWLATRAVRGRRALEHHPWIEDIEGGWAAAAPIGEAAVS